MRMCVQTAAYVEHPAPMQQLCDGTRPPFILLGAMQQQLAKDALLLWSTPLAHSAPIAETIPGNKANKSVVDLMHEPPDPVPPKELKSVHGRAADPRFATRQIRFQPPQDALGHFLIHLTVMLKRQTRISPGAVWLIPHAPIPVAHGFTPPLFNAAPDHIGALIGEPPHRMRTSKRRAKPGEGDHGRSADVEDGLNTRRKGLPVCDEIWRVYVKEKNTDDLRVQLSQSLPYLLTVRS